MRFFDRNRTGDLMTRLSADTDWCRHFLSYIDYVVVDSITMFLSTSIYLFFVNWKLALAWKGQIACTRSIAPGPGMFGPELKNEVADFFEKLTPLYEYFNRFKV